MTVYTKIYKLGLIAACNLQLNSIKRQAVFISSFIYTVTYVSYKSALEYT